jgi:hypothetical protein
MYQRIFNFVMYTTRFAVKKQKIIITVISLILGGSLVGAAVRPTDINLVVKVSDCENGGSIAGAFVEVPTAANGSVSQAYTDGKGLARIYPLRFGGQEHEIRVQARGYQTRSTKERMKEWSSNEIQLCLLPDSAGGATTQLNNVQFISWSEKFPVPQPPPIVEECQCVAYWSHTEFGGVISLGVAGLSPDLMILLSYFDQIPPEYGKWKKQEYPSSGDTLIIRPKAVVYLYSATGMTYMEHIQYRPGHIGIVEKADYLDNVSIDLVGKHYDTFSGWHVRLRNANWPAAWMENNRYYAEHVGDAEHEMICKNVGVSDLIIPEQDLVSYWARQ